MKFTIILLLSAGALASPVGSPSAQEDDNAASFGGGPSRGGQYEPCSGSGFFGNSATCCSFDIIGAASLGCKPPARNPRSPAEFKALCGAKKPKCCFIDPAGGIVNAICPNPVGF